MRKKEKIPENKVRVTHLYVGNHLERVDDKVRLVFICQKGDGRYYLEGDETPLKYLDICLLERGSKIKRLETPFLKDIEDQVFVNTKNEIFTYSSFCTFSLKGKM